ncbi:MAG: tetratricopeptide repeat protein [Reichenbachiella sp.]
MGKKVLLYTCILATICGTLYLWPTDNNRNLPRDLEISRKHLSNQNFDTAISTARLVLESAKNKNNQAYAEAIIGYSYYILGDLDSSYIHYKNSLNFSNQSDSVDHLLKASTFNMLGAIFETKAIYKKSIQYYQSSIDIYESFDKPEIVKVYYNLAYNQSQINDIECVKSYYKALEYATQFENFYYETICLNDLGNLMLTTENYEAAIEYFTMSLKSEYTQGKDDIKSFAYQGLGEAYFLMENYIESEENLKKALSFKEKLDNKKYIFTAQLYLARLKKAQGDFHSSEDLYGKAIEYFPLADHNRENIAVFKELSAVQAELGKMDESNDSKVRHYAELEKYLDERERAAELARQDQFDATVAVSEAQYRKNNIFTFIKDEMNWVVFIKAGCILYMIFFLLVAEKKTRSVRMAFS